MFSRAMSMCFLHFRELSKWNLVQDRANTSATGRMKDSYRLDAISTFAWNDLPAALKVPLKCIGI